MISDEPRVLIRTEALNKFYKLDGEKRESVTDLSLKVMRGEFLIVDGLSGMQKNAFYNLIGCVERPDSGKYYFDYEDVALADSGMLDSLRKYKIGYVFRDYRLVPWLSVYKNVELPLIGAPFSSREKKERVESLLRKLNIYELAYKKAGAVSDFEQQLAAVARAMINNPLMIMADEPAANLNEEEESAIMELIMQLNSEGTAVMLFTDKKALKELNKYRHITFAGGKLCSDRDTYKLSLVRREA